MSQGLADASLGGRLHFPAGHELRDLRHDVDDDPHRQGEEVGDGASLVERVVEERHDEGLGPGLLNRVEVHRPLVGEGKRARAQRVENGAPAGTLDEPPPNSHWEASAGDGDELAPGGLVEPGTPVCSTSITFPL